MQTRSRHLDDFYVAGVRYWDAALVINKLKAGKKLTLVAEPDNPFDPNAVAIYRKGVKLGYVPRVRNSLVAQLLAFGHDNVVECRILKVDRKAETYEQIHVGLYLTDKRASTSGETSGYKIKIEATLADSPESGLEEAGQ